MFAPVSLGQVVGGRTDDGFAITDTLHAAGTRLASHAHAHPALTIVLGGRFTEVVDGQTFDCRCGDVLFKPGGAPHSNSYGRHTRSLVLEILPERLTSLAPFDLGASDPHLHRGGLAFGYGLQLRSAVHDVSADSLIAAEELVLAIIGRSCAGRGALPNQVIDDVAKWIRQKCAGTIQLSDLGRRFSYHPMALARAFRRQHGLSVGQFVHRCRVERAIDLMIAGSDSLAAVAIGAGFADQSHFCRVFRRVIHGSPGRWRRAFDALSTSACLPASIVQD